MTVRPSPFRADLLQGKVALVTGGATGLGLEIARVFGSHGARVAICSRKEPNLQAAVRALREEGIEAVYGVCDVRRHDEVAADEGGVVDLDRQRESGGPGVVGDRAGEVRGAVDDRVVIRCEDGELRVRVGDVELAVDRSEPSRIAEPDVSAHEVVKAASIVGFCVCLGQGGHRRAAGESTER